MSDRTGRTTQRKVYHWITGTGFDVWQIIEAYKSLGSVEKMLGAGEVDKQFILQALEYYATYPEEIDWRISRNARTSEDWYARYPHLVPDPNKG